MSTNFMNNQSKCQKSHESNQVHIDDTPQEFPFHMDNFTDTLSQTQHTNIPRLDEELSPVP